MPPTYNYFGKFYRIGSKYGKGLKKLASYYGQRAKMFGHILKI